ncbi:hypothetical protein Hypma_005271 [Hypsizygus marmoreus]|uniref:Uncharacterized protein n=1 Tax=Hypsizygus marmoreus TaxID=39966 RepID=A0A369JWR6_HYPMA|nr:hypothetical protein Hypma_005271 [Hypsizygus marmoreus]
MFSKRAASLLLFLSICGAPAAAAAAAAATEIIAGSDSESEKNSKSSSDTESDSGISASDDIAVRTMNISKSDRAGFTYGDPDGSDVETDDANAHDVKMTHAADVNEVKTSAGFLEDADTDMVDTIGDSIDNALNANTLNYASTQVIAGSLESGTQSSSDNENEDVDMAHVTP